MQYQSSNDCANKIKEDRTISSVVKDNLCTGCGTCISLCPNKAIKLKVYEKKGIFIPELENKWCTHCGICYKICPGHEVDFRALNFEIFGKKPKDILIGNYINCYVGYATDYDIRYSSASGGLVTALLIFALEEGLINGALVTRMKKDKPLEPEPFIARTKDEIIAAATSKYCPVPANIAIKQILEATEGERFAVVGLPCHIHGIRKAEQSNIKLKEKIVLHLGLFCSKTRNFLSQDYLFRKFHVKKEDVVKFDYRGEGWIGRMTIVLKNGNKIFSPYTIYYAQLRSFFVPIRCTLCSDHFCEIADVSFGDIWLPEFQKEKIGISQVISRNNVSETFLKNAESKKKIELNNIDRDKIIKSQENVLFQKKSYLKNELKLLKFFGKKVPIYNQELLDPKFSWFMYTIFLYSNIYISSKRFLWKFLDIYSSILKFGDKLLRKK